MLVTFETVTRYSMLEFEHAVLDVDQITRGASPTRMGDSARFSFVRFEETMEHVAKAFEVLGVAIIAVGCLLALLAGARQFTHFEVFFAQVRRSFGRPLILGLEILVAADIIETITVDRTLESGAALGIVVLVRVILSFSLDIEVDGILPWRRAETEAMLEAQASPD